MDEQSPLLLERAGPLAILKLNRPHRRNAINAALARAMRQALRDIAAGVASHTGANPGPGAETDAIRAVILTGGPSFFCAGMDLQAFLNGEGPEINDGEGRFAGFTAHTLEVPVIAAVEGPALAGGFELALACDLVVAGESAYFGLPESGVGLFPAAGGAFRLARKLPAAMAMECICAGTTLPAADAHRVGLINCVTEDGAALTAAIALGEAIAAKAPLGVMAGLKLARQALAADEASLWSANDALWKTVMASKDAQEGPAAFLEKRQPEWKGE